MIRVTTLAALALTILGLGALTLPGRASPAAAPLGPGGILKLHEELFEALDEHDYDAARGLLDVDRKGRDVQLLLDDGGDHPITGLRRGSSDKALIQWAKATGTDTTIRRHQVECPSADVSYAILEFERIQPFTDGSRRLRRFRATSLVRATDRGWKLFHWHISPAEDDGQLLKG